MMFQTPDEAALWAEVYVAYIRAPHPMTVAENAGPAAAHQIADQAVRYYRDRSSQLQAGIEGPYSECTSCRGKNGTHAPNCPDDPRHRG